MKILHVAEILDSDDDRLFRCVNELCGQLVQLGHEITLAYGVRGSRPILPLESGVRGVPIALANSRLLASAIVTGKSIASALADFDGLAYDWVHLHGPRLGLIRAGVQYARERGIKIALSPRGMLERSALQQHALCKRLSMRLFQARDLNSVCLFHANSDREARSIRSVVPGGRVVVFPNGVEFGKFKQAEPTDNKRRALFLSRLHEYKSLEELIRAWAKVRPADWTLEIVGTGALALRGKIERLAADMKLGDCVLLLGQANDLDKVEFYARYDLFILPTKAEGFGIFIDEALASGLPVITTTCAPCKILEKTGSGWWIDTSAEALTAVLRTATSLPRTNLFETGAAGASIVAGKFFRRACAELLSDSYSEPWKFGFELSRDEVPSLGASRVGHVIGSISRNHGGTAVFAAELCSRLADDPQNSVTLFVSRTKTDLPIGAGVDLRDVGLNKPSWSEILVPSSGSMTQGIRSWMIEGGNLIHVHGLWLPICRVAIDAAYTAGRPVVLSTHGMLEPWCLAHKPLKKKLAMLLYQHRDLQRVSVFHTTVREEADQIRRLGYKQPIAVIPIGVPLPEWKERRYDSKKIALFLSRIHPKKGILELVEVWGRYAPVDWELEIAGNDDGGHLDKILRRIKELGIGERVHYVGPAFGTEKERLFRKADMFVLPSYSENFGIVIAEALSYGVPVFTTTATPWSVLVEKKCGWWIKPGVMNLGPALREAMLTERAELIAMGARARTLAEDYYQWPHLTQKFSDLYRWVLQRGTKPHFILE